MSTRPAAPQPIGRLVDVGGYRLHLACPKHVETLLAEQQAVQAIHAELAAAITSLGDLPLIVLSHGQPMPMPGLPDAVNQANEQLWQELQAELAKLSSRGRPVVAHGSGHYIHMERPQLVVDAIAQPSGLST